MAFDNHNDIQLIFSTFLKLSIKSGIRVFCIDLNVLVSKVPCMNFFVTTFMTEDKELFWMVSQAFHKALSLDLFCFSYIINDIGINLSSKASLFAPDTSLSKQIIDDHTSNNELQVDLDTIQTWADKWQVIFNPLKSESMLVLLRSNNGNGQTFTFQNHVIYKVDTHKHLGLSGIVVLLGKVICRPVIGI